ncbi:hypothetical protein CO174_04060 [Candidatus Uhrbacteria bacterium CG_4_9_14_3_um_filter_50_9]|uniref:Uncharacterized protein n=1 Tax=Candidatus Uhrbacteria bacterium CG_4_9_14_3_um_filter_50_9 TaxID=1975035 RepID=A0A2M7XBI0_9BACT|nr:MAG: hypothetical protein CO174_04060 [Candidatus Uhrbacteria bacterium CG_4_9_14_3_um_filter_50_9]
MNTLTLFAIGLHAFIAWILMEVYVNNAHRFSRTWYIALHYGVVVLVFGAVFATFFQFHHGVSVFWTTVLGMLYVITIEIIVFRYLYSGERWFLNFIDWIFPMFIATTTIYAVGMLLS